MSDLRSPETRQPERVAVYKECTRTYGRVCRCVRWQAAECFPEGRKFPQLGSHLQHVCSQTVAREMLHAKCMETKQDRMRNASKHRKKLMQPASYGHQVVEKLHREALQTPCACRAEIQAMRKQRKQRPRKQRGASCSDSDKEDPPGLCVACRKHPLAFGAVTLFTRKCPQCNAVVHSNIRDGLIDTRNTLEARTDGKEPACGYQFMVEDVEVVQAHTYHQGLQIITNAHIATQPRCQANDTDASIQGITGEARASSSRTRRLFCVNAGEVVRRAACLHAPLPAAQCRCAVSLLGRQN